MPYMRALLGNQVPGSHFLPTLLLGDGVTMFLPAPHLPENLVIGWCVCAHTRHFPKYLRWKNGSRLRRRPEEPEKAKDAWKKGAKFSNILDGGR